MKINITVPNSMHVTAFNQPWEEMLPGPGIGRAMRRTDELGFHKLMLGEHFIIPKSHVPMSGDHYFHTVVALGYLAGQTERMRLSTSVSILPLQNPIVQAKAWSTLDFLSGGRATALFGVGWLEEEFRLLFLGGRAREHELKLLDLGHAELIDPGFLRVDHLREFLIRVGERFERG